MFAVIRNGLGKTTQGMRERHTLGLFVFEFFVVVLGVLAAQGLQEWARQREQQHHVERELERLSQGYVSAQQSATVWSAAIPCLRARIEHLMRDAATGVPVRPLLIQRPRLISASYSGTDVETEAGIAAMLGARKSVALLDVQARAVNMDENMQAMLTRWEKFRLLDPTYGPVSASDRSIAREAGADILMHMRSLEIAIVNIEERAPDLSIPDKSPPVTGDVAPVTSCAQLWADGTAYSKVK